jgi:hypothetical protein
MVTPPSKNLLATIGHDLNRHSADPQRNGTIFTFSARLSNGTGISDLTLSRALYAQLPFATLAGFFVKTAICRKLGWLSTPIRAALLRREAKVCVRK